MCQRQAWPANGGDAQKVSAVALIPVASSQIAAVGYDSITRKLVMRFRGSGRGQQPIYSYDGVPAEIAAELVAAGSPGSYFHQHIRQRGYPFRRHDGVAP
jgi:hypothetical protein